MSKREFYLWLLTALCLALAGSIIYLTLPQEEAPFYD